VLTTRNAATDTHIGSGELLVSFTFMLKMLVTKDNCTYRKASRVIICPYCACYLMDPTSMTLIELLRRVEKVHEELLEHIGLFRDILQDQVWMPNVF
jgi:hypothetical protein